MTKEDMYKFMVYILYENGFVPQSTERIEEIGATVIHHKRSFFKDHKMGRLKLESYFLDNKNKIKVRGPDSCVLDYFWHEIKGRRGFKSYTYDKLLDELSYYDTTNEFPLLSTREIVNWIKAKHNNISLHAYSCTDKKFMSHIPHAPDVILTFFVKDNHCHPITKPE